jgi:hypothetical protein
MKLYFRLFGYGLVFMRAADHPSMFSGSGWYRQVLYVGPYKIGVLTP